LRSVAKMGGWRSQGGLAKKKSFLGWMQEGT
jgi:hypothetical protein